jgi:thiol-disulfide isomerase/thioredoxin
MAALVLFVVGDNYLHVGADLRVAVTVLAFLYLCAGIIRGHNRPKNTWLKGLLLSSGASVILLVLGSDSLPHLILATFLLIAIVFAACGVRVRRLWAAQSALRGGVTALACMAALVVLALTTIPALATRIATRKMSAPAPAFSISRLDGSAVESRELRGRVVVLDFWATWCPACRRELPEIEKLYRRYQGNPMVTFWAVDVQKDGETPEKARDFMKKAGYTLPVACGSEKSLDSLSVEGFPALIVIDKSGKVRLVHVGYDRSEQLHAAISGEIQTLLDERL